MNDQDLKPLCGWTRLFHPRGVQVTLPVGIGFDFGAAFAEVDAALSAGWLVREVGLEAGEEKDTVAFVLRGQSEGRDGTTDFLLLYSDNDAYKFSFLKVYLNKEADVQAFEAASGMTLASIPVYIGQDKPERGKNKRVDEGFIIPARKAFGVIFKANPKWSKEAADAAASRKEMYTVPKRVFVRWDGTKPSEPAQGAAQRQEENGLVTSGQVQVIEDLLKELKEVGGRLEPKAILNWLKANDWYELDQKRFNMCRNYLDDLIAKRKAVAQ